MANTNETYAARIQRKLMKKQYLVEVATGRRKADLVLKNATYVNVFSNELCHGRHRRGQGPDRRHGRAMHGEVEYDVSGKIVCPGFIDAHIHLESSLVSPRGVCPAPSCRTGPRRSSPIRTRSRTSWAPTALIICSQATEGLPIDVRFMLPSCVPATPLDESGANLDYRAIDSFYDHARVQGLAEMMNYVGVVARRRGGHRQDRCRAGAPQEDRRSRARPVRQGSGLPISRRASIPTTSAPIWTMPWRSCATASSS